MLAPHALGPDPPRHEGRSVLLEKILPEYPVRVAREHHGPIAQVREDIVRDRSVKLDEVTLRVLLLGPEDFLEVGERDLAIALSAGGEGGDPFFDRARSRLRF